MEAASRGQSEISMVQGLSFTYNRLHESGWQMNVVKQHMKGVNDPVLWCGNWGEAR